MSTFFSKNKGDNGSAGTAASTIMNKATNMRYSYLKEEA